MSNLGAPKVLHDYGCLKIVQSLALSQANSPIRGWKTQVTEYHIQVDDRLIAEIKFEDIQCFVQSLEQITSEAHSRGIQDAKKKPVKARLAQNVTKDLPHF